MSQAIEWVAHRGDRARFPENTLPAIQGAVEAGAQYVEIDVQLSGDGVPVLLHDETLQRTAGVDKRVFDCSLAELASLTVGEPERLGDRFGDVLLPTLRQAVDLLNRTPYVTVFVELKRHSLSHFGVARAVAELLEAMAEARFPWVLISFVDEAVRHFQASARGSAGWVLREYDAPSRTRAETLAPDYLIIKNSRIPHGIDRLWPGPWRWMVYDVDDAASALRCTEIGASLIETNRLETMMSLPAFSGGSDR